MIYKCLDCGRIFDEENSGIFHERYEAWGKVFSEEYTVCPVCRSDNLEEAEEYDEEDLYTEY